MQKMGRISIVSDASLTLSLRAQCEQALMEIIPVPLFQSIYQHTVRFALF